MQGTKYLLRALAGFGLISALFTGCQNPLDQKNDPTPAVQDQTPSELSLKLSIKDSGACLDLKNQIEAVKAGGAVDAELIAKFANQCVVESKGDKPAADVDDQVRCRWIVSQIESGHDELVVKFRYYCPDSCETMVMEDSTEHAKVCRDPKPEEKPNCEDLKKRLAGMDTATEDYARLRHFVAEVCAEPKPLPQPEPKPITCDELRKMFDQATTTEDSIRIDKELKARCPVPHPEPGPTPTPCDSLRKLLAATHNPEDSARIAMEIAKRCVEPQPLPRPNCDSLRALLKGFAAGSEGYNRIYHMMAENKCVLPDTGTPVPKPITCDSLRKLLAATHNPEDSARIAMEIAKRCVEPQPLPRPNCDSLRALLKGFAVGSEGYNKIYHAMAENKCVLPDTGTPVPKPITCDSLRKLLAATHNPEDSARIAMEIAKRCGEPQPLPLPHPNCDSLRALLKGFAVGSEGYNKIYHAMAENKCVLPDTGAPAPKPLSYCDSLRHEAALQKEHPDAYNKLLALIAEKCPEPNPAPAPVPPACDERRAKLAGMTPGTDDYARYQAELIKYCPDTTK